MLRLLRHHYPFRSFALLFGEAVAILAALVAGVLLRLGSLEPILHTPLTFAVRAGVVIVVCLVVLFLNDLYEFELADTKVSLLTRTLRALGLAFVILALVYYLIPELLLGRGVFALAFTLMTLVIFGWRLLYLWLVMGRAPRRNVLVVGCEDLAVDIAKEVLRH
jgi:FlaA1/EpsC-like NDP-sugar epimerase